MIIVLSSPNPLTGVQLYDYLNNNYPVFWHFRCGIHYFLFISTWSFRNCIYQLFTPDIPL